MFLPFSFVGVVIVLTMAFVAALANPDAAFFAGWTLAVGSTLTAVFLFAEGENELASFLLTVMLAALASMAILDVL